MATTVGLVHLDFHIPQASSLKDKRHVLKGFKDRLAVAHNVSVSEVASQNDRRRGVLAIAMVGSDKRYVAAALQKIVDSASAHREMVLVNSEVEWI